MSSITRMDIVDIELNSGNVHRSWLNHSIGSGDNNANAFGVRLFRNSEPVDIGSGWVQGFFRNSQGQNIALTENGVIDGNMTYVTLPQACYNYEGQFTLAIKLVSPGFTSTVTMRIVDGIVDNTNTGGAVAPTGTVPTYQEILAVYDDLVASLEEVEDYADNFAPEFAAGTANAAGSYVMYEGDMYLLPNGHTANTTWANTTKTQVNVGGQLTDLKSAFGGINGIVEDTLIIKGAELSNRSSYGQKIVDGGIVVDSTYKLYRYPLTDLSPVYIKTINGYQFRSGEAANTTIKTVLGDYEGLVYPIPGSNYICVNRLDSDTSDTVGAFGFTYGVDPDKMKWITDTEKYLSDISTDNINAIGFEWEKGNFSVSSGIMSYSSSTIIQRFKEGTSFALEVGDVVSLKDYTNAGIKYSYSTDNGTTWSNTSLKDSDLTISTAGLYRFAIYNKSAGYEITEVFTRTFRITKANSWKKTVDTRLSDHDDLLDRVLVKNVVPPIANAIIHGITFTQNADGSFTISGSLESGYDTVQRIIYYSKTVMPDWISHGRYRVRLVGFDSRLELHGYEYDENESATNLFIVKKDDVYDFTVSKNAHGFALYFYVIDDIPTAITVKPILSPAEILTGSGTSASKSIVSFNADREPLIIQNKAVRGTAFDSDHPVIAFTHFSDIHKNQKLWNRVAEFTNAYKDYINFAIMTGDYVGDNLDTGYADLIGDGTPFEVPLYMCVGNHDTYEDSQHTQASKADAYAAVFTGASTTGATFMTGDYSMTYYVDFAGSNLRIIVLDNYYDTSAQAEWLAGVLSTAKSAGYAVATFMHRPSAKFTAPLDCSFMTLDDHSSEWTTTPFESVIAAFISGGGEYVGNFCGHHHRNYIGFTAGGVLNILVPAATDYAAYNDSARVSNTRTYDCFDVVGIDTNTKMLKIIRIGNNADHYLRNQNVLCYDYANKEIVCNY